MAIRRACSYSATIKTPKAPSNYSAMLLTIAQNGRNYINKSNGDAGLSTTATGVVVQLTQAETAQFESGADPAYIQLRLYASAYEAPGSACFAVDVLPALNEEVLP